MRLWHYKLMPYLPKKMLVSQWRECIAIKRQWEKGTLKHPLVSYVKNHSKEYFLQYVQQLLWIMDERNINYKDIYYAEIDDFCHKDKFSFHPCDYPEHNNRYLEQCYYNLQEKYDRGVITQEEWQKIEDLFKSEVK